MNNIWNNPISGVIISVIWGVGFALLFKKVCPNNKCLLIRVPPEFENGDNIIHDGKKCYKLTKYPAKCT